MFNILTLNKISATGLSYFDKAKYAVADDFTDPDAIIVRSASMHDMELSENTMAIARAGAGVNNIPVDACTEKGVVVFNTPGANANAVKELVICALLLSSRKIAAGMDWCKTLKGQGAEVGKLVEKGKGAFVGPEISGKKLGVIGLGAIGVLVANAANALGMQVYGYDPYLSVDAAWNLSRSIKHSTNIKEIFENCDYITLHIPATPDTKGMINAESIELMPDGVRILNFARGELVDSADLLAALGSGKVAAYATDFPSDDLLGANGVLAIPHLGASTPESEENCAQMAVIELMGFLQDGNIKNSVNLPTVELPRSAGTRLTLIHKNIPNMINQITSTFTAENVNIENMVNKSKGTIAYTVIDADGDIPEHAIECIKVIDGMVKVRVIK